MDRQAYQPEQTPHIGRLKRLAFASKILKYEATLSDIHAEHCMNIKKPDRLLLTGATGALGTVLRAGLAPWVNRLRLSDLLAMPPATESEELVVCDLADKAMVDALVRGCDAIVHMGGVSVERPFEEVLEANIKGVFHLYESARRHGVKRVVFASSNHVVGFHRRSERLDADCLRRPDSYYGLSKSYGKICRVFTLTVRALRPPACASAPAFRNPKIAGCW